MRARLKDLVFSHQLTRYAHHFVAYARRGLFVEGVRMASAIALARLGAEKLPVLFISPSHRCNATCYHCFERFRHEKHDGELTTGEVEELLDQFAALGGAKVFFCSGEFLLRPDALALIRSARRRRMLVAVTTNGLLLDEAMIDRLRDAGLTDLIVSLDSADPATHDRYRGVPGCFARATRGLRLARERGIATFIWTYVSRTNFAALEGIYRLSRELEVEETFVYFPILSGHLFDRPEENLTPAERDAFRRRFNGRPRFNLEFPAEESICEGGGRNHINVMPSGDTTFCPPVPYSYGNVRTRPLRDCLRDIRADHARFCVERCTGQCPVNFPEYRAEGRGRFMYGDLERDDVTESGPGPRQPGP